MADYWHSLDREKYFRSYADIPNLPEGYKPANRDYSIRQIGSSRWLHGQDTNPIRAVMADIRAGAGHIELTAPGTGRGGGGNPTFEEIDSQQREELREIQKAIDVSITTHATPSAWGLTGLDPRSGQFNDAERESNIKELFKAIDFASEATKGGSVVVHTGEFQRSLYDMPGHEGKFQSFEGEKGNNSFIVVDTKDNKIAGMIPEDNKLWVPKIERDEKGNPQVMRDDAGNIIRDSASNLAIPKYVMKPGTQDIELEGLSFDDYVRRMIRDHPSEIKDILKSMYQDPNLIYSNPNSTYVKEAVAVEWAKEQQRSEMVRLAGQSNYSLRVQQARVEKMNAQERLDQFKRLKDENPDLYEEQRQRFGQDPVYLFNEMIRNWDQQIAEGFETNVATQKALKEMEDKLNRLEPLRKVALEKSFESFAKLGIYAMEKSEGMKKVWGDKNKDQLKPIFVSMENVYPAQGYGSEVDELISLVKGSRQKMAQLLQEERKIEAAEAKKLAEQHIKVTFDTGHFNMWKRYFRRNDGESQETYDARFKEWYMGQVRKLAKEGILGNVHIADNFGYDDSHLGPGMGNAPIQDVLKEFKKAGYNGEFAVEGGFNQGKNGFQMAWANNFAPIFKERGTAKWVDVGASFTNTYQSYHRHRHRPYFVFGSYSPSDDWKPWSGTNME